MEGLGLLHPLVENRMTEERNCPRDGSELASRAVGSAEILVCGMCHGLWISGYDMASLMRSPYESWKLPWVEKYRSDVRYVEDTIACLCAKHSPMETVTRKGVRVDLCPECGGLWFDGGELEEFVRKRGGKSYNGTLDFEGPENAEDRGGAAFLGVDLLLDVLLFLFLD
jgi:Zn-finger nucleic acid-binding protein